MIPFSPPRIDDKVISGLNPVERNIAQIFQFPVIYDTMTVYDNLAFPLRNRKIPEEEIKVKVLTLDG